MAAASPDCLEAFVKMLCLTEAIVKLRLPNSDLHKPDDFVNCVTTSYRKLYRNMEHDRQYLGLRTILFQTLCQFGNPERVVIGLMTNDMTSK